MGPPHKVLLDENAALLYEDGLAYHKLETVMVPVLIVMVGLPASGKSSVAKPLCELIRKERGACVVVSSDSYIERWAKELGATYQEVFAKCSGPATRRMWEDLRQAARRGVPIVQDRLNHTRQARERCLREAGTRHFRVAAVMPFDVEGSRERNRQREGRAVPDCEFLRISEKYEAPQEDEGFHAILTAPPPETMKWDERPDRLAAWFWYHVQEAENTDSKGTYLPGNPG